MTPTNDWLPFSEFCDRLKSDKAYIGDDGHIYRKDGRPLSRLSRNGYYTVRKMYDGHVYCFMEHRVVWYFVHGSLDSTKVINHKDFDRGNNHIENLELISQKENTKYSRKNNRYPSNAGCANGRAALTEKEVQAIRYLAEHGWKQNVLAEMFGAKNPNLISRVVSGARYGNVENASSILAIYPTIVMKTTSTNRLSTSNLGMKGSLKVKISEPSVELINAPDYKTLLTTIEAAGRTCYKSEDKITDGSAEKFVRGIIKRGHEAVIEHGSLTVRFICDRGVSHEIVRHRLAAFCQESTRYCNYGKEGFGGEITVIRPSTFAKTDSTYHIWKRSCEHAEVAYFDLLNEGCTPQEARSVLPNSLKTEVVMTADLREWRHFCRMRCPVAAHPDMRVVANMLLTLLKQTYPVFFEDIEV